MADRWNWKPKNAPAGGLLYEPGNWGDLLKCAWLLEVLPRLHQGLGAFTYVDPFAGAPDYPLTPGTTRRLDLLRGTLLAERVLPFVTAGHWPSAASLAADSGLPPQRLLVFDADPQRRSLLAADGRFNVLDLRDGWETVGRAGDEPPPFLFIDPYDFLAEWRQRLDPLLGHARRHAVLAYIYNRAARGSEHLAEYRAFRAALLERSADIHRLQGRVPADGFLPSAHHEMLLLAGEPLAARIGWMALVERLTSITEAVAGAVDRSGRME